MLGERSSEASDSAHVFGPRNPVTPLARTRRRTGNILSTATLAYRVNYATGCMSFDQSSRPMRKSSSCNCASGVGESRSRSQKSFAAVST